MSDFSRRRALAGAVAVVAFSSPSFGGEAFFADSVVAYSAGNDPNNFWLDPQASIGKPNGNTGFGVLTPFNGAFDGAHITGIGAGGSLTLKLDKTTASAGYSLGIHAAVGLIDNNWPNGDPGPVATPYTSPRVANLQVSFDGDNWVDLGIKNFTIPTNFHAEGVTQPGFQEEPGTAEADWSKPFTQPLSSFNGQTWSQMLTTLDGTGGGDWLNLAVQELPGINYVRFIAAADAPFPMIVDSVIGNTDNQTLTGAQAVSNAAPLIEAPGGSIVTNHGTVTISSAMAVMGSSPQPASSFINHGTVQTTAPGTTSFHVPVYSDAGTFDTQAGTLALNGRFITGSGSITKLGPGTLIVAGPQYHNPGSTFTAAAGLTRFQTDAAGLTVNASALVNFESTQHLAGLNVSSAGVVTVPAAGSRDLYLDDLQISAGGTLDLNDHDLVVDNGNFSDILNLVFAGYGGAPDTNLTGIISSTGQANGGNTILAVVDNSLVGYGDHPLGSGNTIGANAVIGKYTYIGDADWDGQVTPNDYTAIDSNLGATVPNGVAWFLGDFDFDGSVTPNDYTFIDTHLGTGEGNPLSSAAGPVPEPATWSLLAALGTRLFARRRRR